MFRSVFDCTCGIALEEIVVTGSRLATGFDTPTPVTMVAADDLAAAVPNKLGDRGRVIAGLEYFKMNGIVWSPVA